MMSHTSSPVQTIGIDCRFAPFPTGLGRYTRELVTELLQRRDPFHYVLFTRTEREDWLPKAFPSGVSVTVFPYAHYSLDEQIKFPSILRKSGIDLLFSPHFNVPLLCPVPAVVTVHDMILHRYPNDASIPRQLAYRTLFRRAVMRAEKIIAVSGFTARELSSHYGRFVARKTAVVHEAVSPHFASRSVEDCRAVLERHGLTRPFFLYVGNAKEHKNVRMLVEAFRRLQDPSHELVLVISGKESSMLELCPGARLLQNVPEEELPCLYSSARCFVSASLYEGFGLPLLESHACGCPAIVTNMSAFPEIAPPGTVLVAPSVEAFREAMASPPQWKENSRRRTWADVAADTASVFREAFAGV